MLSEILLWISLVYHLCILFACTVFIGSAYLFFVYAAPPPPLPCVYIITGTSRPSREAFLVTAGDACSDASRAAACPSLFSFFLCRCRTLRLHSLFTLSFTHPLALYLPLFIFLLSLAWLSLAPPPLTFPPRPAVSSLLRCSLIIDSLYSFVFLSFSPSLLLCIVSLSFSFLRV